MQTSTNAIAEILQFMVAIGFVAAIIYGVIRGLTF
ncbi:hypothetical protein RAS1_25550 [Phycisphaerae bacterium RAS1]|nr:hypothetical protein RAS1_25550 [Phycisphaerae bacterium RAS1]